MNDEHILSMVLDVYQKCKINTLPIDCFKLITDYGYKIFTYEELKETNVELYTLCLSCSNEAFIHRFMKIAAYKANNNTYRIRFSLMHELGHIVLNTDNEDVADYFASCVLAPRILIHKLGCRTADDIHNTFALSYAASNRALIDYKNWFRKIGQQTPRKPSPPEEQLEHILAEQIKQRKQRTTLSHQEPQLATPSSKHKSFKKNERFQISDEVLFAHLKNCSSEKKKAKMLGISIEDYLIFKYNFRFSD